MCVCDRATARAHADYDCFVQTILRSLHWRTVPSWRTPGMLQHQSCAMIMRTVWGSRCARCDRSSAQFDFDGAHRCMRSRAARRGIGLNGCAANMASRSGAPARCRRHCCVPSSSSLSPSVFGVVVVVVVVRTIPFCKCTRARVLYCTRSHVSMWRTLCTHTQTHSCIPPTHSHT